MLAKMARSAPRSPFGVPRMTAIVRAAKRSCQNAAKAQKSTTVRGSSGESRLKHRVTAPTVLRGAGLVWRAMKMRTQYWIGTICLILMAWIIFFTLMWAP